MLTLLRTVKFQHIILTTAWVHGVIMPLRSGGAQSTHNLYDVKPLKIGVEVFGVDLQKDVTDDIKAQIKADVTKHKIVVFRDQGIVSGDRHVELSEWFGPCESTFYKHSKSPHPDVFRVSNDDDEGCRGVGRTGWHVDGSFQPAPFSYALYHIWSVPKDGDTVFVDLNALILSLSTEQRQRWERLSMVADRRMNRIHPLLYTHPITGHRTMCFHLGMTEAFVWDEGTQNERLTSPSETRKLLQEIHNEIVKNNRELIMEHKWQSGDFIMSDNLAVGHEAHPSTQLSPDVVGLRIMHRTTVKGIRPPAKFYKDGPQPKDEL